MVNRITERGLKKNIGKQVFLWKYERPIEGVLSEDNSTGFQWFVVDHKDGAFILNESNKLLDNGDRIGITYKSGLFRIYDVDL